MTANQALRVDANRRTVARQAVGWDQFASAFDDREPFPLFGTGVNVDRGQPDPHWSITDVDHAANFTPRPAVEWEWPSDFGPLRRQSGRCISLTNPPMAPPGCRMTFRTSFDLTGFDPATATIGGRFIADDWIVEVRLNGKKLPLGNHRLWQWKAFRIDEGFVAGSNTVEMVVENDPAEGQVAMGLCLEWKGSARRVVKRENGK